MIIFIAYEIKEIKRGESDSNLKVFLQVDLLIREDLLHFLHLLEALLLTSCHGWLAHSDKLFLIFLFLLKAALFLLKCLLPGLSFLPALYDQLLLDAGSLGGNRILVNLFTDAEVLQERVHQLLYFVQQLNGRGVAHLPFSFVSETQSVKFFHLLLNASVCDWIKHFIVLILCCILKYVFLCISSHNSTFDLALAAFQKTDVLVELLFELFEFMLLSFKLSFCFLTLLDQEEVLFF